MKPKRRASTSWIGFLLALTSSFLTGLILWLVSLILLYSLPENVFYAFQGWTFTLVGVLCVSLVSFAVLFLATYNQARFIRDRYEYVEPKTIALNATFWFAGISAAFFVLDWWDGYTWAPEDFLVEGLSIVIFYLASRRFLAAKVGAG